MTALRRTTAAPPVRIVHLGLGAFHRAHQAWYTQAAGDGWGIAAFTGRDPKAAVDLASQGGLYTLIERNAGHDSGELVSSIAEAVDGAHIDRLVELVAAETTALVTLTVTEAGYRLRPDGTPDESDPVVAADLAGASPRSPLARLALALDARRHSGAPIAIVPCDNLPHNGAFVRAGLLAFAERRDPALAAWIDENVSFVSTSVDRITPRLADADRGITDALMGWTDVAPVITEPFHDWILSGDFPAGRPAWEAAGARFVDEIEPFEYRKLWLLNGAHSLLAYLGQLRGHTVVAQAIADPVCRDRVLEFWDEATRTLDNDSLDLPDYRAALLARFENARIRHELAQIALDGETKLRVRIVPTARAERAAGRDARGAACVIAAWVVVTDRGAGTREMVATLDPDLATDSAFIDTITNQRKEIERDQP